MGKYPKISIITPVLNQADFIKRAIRSVMEQNYPNLEYIVVDGGSTDGTLDILEDYKSELFLITEKDKGQTNAINKGLKRATGEILGYLNSDDIYLPGTLQKVADFFIKEQEIMWASGRCKIIDETGREIRSLITLWKNFWLDNRFFSHKKFLILLIMNFISQPATFWRRKIFREVGFFDESLKFVMDYDYWLRIINKYQLGIINFNLACFRIQSKSKSVKGFSQQFNEGYKVAKRYTNSKTLLLLHKLHDLITIGIYKSLL